ncbi:hypothetical protein D0C16_09440 [Cellvibrio sp. KY-GH-1]|uniref:hypothetical protein n=1 Tax=Cellvibrio sp. KY-GH-1 TaxID=2303332 RepID=UPI001248C029|nr:hypothetical protein [Cellvibrio sp. KY-GH-1]QEY16180.1 hypothetical protein D0C16_09440 [Cellvibrio sp. KY-GH-1]
MLLTDGDFWGINNLKWLLGEYYDLARDSVELIPVNSRFYREMLSLHKKIFAGRAELLPEEMVELINGSYQMWSVLMEWKSFSSSSNDVRVSSKYEDILYDFVGSWESLPSFIDNNRGADYLDLRCKGLTKHLAMTALTSIAALRFDNVEAAVWGVDMLNNWYGNLNEDGYFDEEYSWRSILINPMLPLKNIEGSEWEKILKNCAFNSVSAFGMALKNASLDVRVLTACYILLKPQTDNHLELVRFVKALLSGELMHKTGTVNPWGDEIADAGSLMGAYFRHRDYISSEGRPYGNWLVSILDSFRRINEERKVPGRIYSGWGADSPRSMHRAYVEIGLFFSAGKWMLPNTWQEIITSGVFDHASREIMIHDLRDWVSTARESRNYILFNNDDIELRISNFCESINNIINDLESIQAEAIKVAKIDDNKLLKIGLASSAVFNSLNATAFPLSLFYKINRVDMVSDCIPYQFNISNFEKKSLASEFSSNVINEGESFANLMKQQVKNRIYSKLIGYPISDYQRIFSLEDLSAVVVSLASSFPCPILFICSRSLKNAIRMTLHDVKVAEALKMSRFDGFAAEYLCHIGLCEVYETPADYDYCLLTSRELFDVIDFYQIDQDRFVDVSFTESVESPNVGELIPTANFGQLTNIHFLPQSARG